MTITQNNILLCVDLSQNIDNLTPNQDKINLQKELSKKNIIGIKLELFPGLVFTHFMHQFHLFPFDISHNRRLSKFEFVLAAVNKTDLAH